jgi:hypothetical protein
MDFLLVFYRRCQLMSPKIQYAYNKIGVLDNWLIS